MELVKNTSNSGLHMAQEYILLGFPVIPVPYGQKNPVHKGWTDLEITMNNAGEYFSHQPSNIAVALGRESSNLVDIDLDSPDAVEFSKIFAIETGCIYGHETRPESHRLYRLVSGDPTTMKFALSGGEMILEIRGKNHLSILPGSKHPDGDMYTFDSDLPPATIGYDALKRSAMLIAVSVLCARCWPQKGSRNTVAMALAGLFYKAGLTLDEARQIVWHVAKSRGDEEAEDRAQAVIDTWKKAESGQPVTGISVLRELFGDTNVTCLKEWLGTSASTIDEELIQEFNQWHAVVGVGNKCKILRESITPPNVQKNCETIDRNDMRALLANKRIMVNGKETEFFKIWFQHPLRRQYIRLVFRPGQEVPDDTYNMWQGFNVQPLNNGNCNKILAHIREVIADGNEEIELWILAWLAHAVQKPSEKPGTALVLRGEQGVGKSILGEYIGRIFGKHYLSVSQSRHIQGNFNAHLQQCVILNAEEAFWGGDKKAAGVVKDLITSKRMAVEKKGVDVTDGENHLRVLMTTNNEWAVPADLSERRFCVIDVSSKKKQDAAYFSALADEMEGDGPAAFLGFLLNYDYTGVNLRQPIKTQALAEQILLGIDKLGQFIFHCLSEGHIYPDNPTWPTTIPTETFSEIFQKWSKNSWMQGHALSTHFGRGLKKYIPSIVRKKLTACSVDGYTGKDIMYTSSKLQWFYILPPLEEARKQFEAQVGQVPWPEDESE